MISFNLSIEDKCCIVDIVSGNEEYLIKDITDIIKWVKDNAYSDMKPIEKNVKSSSKLLDILKKGKSLLNTTANKADKIMAFAFKITLQNLEVDRLYLYELFDSFKDKNNTTDIAGCSVTLENSKIKYLLTACPYSMCILSKQLFINVILDDCDIEYFYLSPKTVNVSLLNTRAVILTDYFLKESTLEDTCNELLAPLPCIATYPSLERFWDLSNNNGNYASVMSQFTHVVRMAVLAGYMDTLSEVEKTLNQPIYIASESTTSYTNLLSVDKLSDVFTINVTYSMGRALYDSDYNYGFGKVVYLKDNSRNQPEKDIVVLRDYYYYTKEYYKIKNIDPICNIFELEDHNLSTAREGETFKKLNLNNALFKTDVTEF